MGNMYADVESIKRLSLDLQDLEEGRFSFSGLDHIPLLDEFAIVHRPVACLAGIVSGHPVLRNGRPSVTSQVFFLDLDRGVARTYSRWFRLGRPAGLRADQ